MCGGEARSSARDQAATAMSNSALIPGSENGPRSVPNDRFRVITVSSPAPAYVVTAAGTSVRITSRAADASPASFPRLPTNGERSFPASSIHLMASLFRDLLVAIGRTTQPNTQGLLFD